MTLLVSENQSFSDTNLLLSSSFELIYQNSKINEKPSNNVEFYRKILSCNAFYVLSTHIVNTVLKLQRTYL